MPSKRVSFSPVDEAFSSIAHQQKGRTCYAQATATLIKEAICRRGCRKDRSDIVKAVVKQFGEAGANTKKVLKWAAKNLVGGGGNSSRDRWRRGTAPAPVSVRARSPCASA